MVSCGGMPATHTHTHILVGKERCGKGEGRVWGERGLARGSHLDNTGAAPRESGRTWLIGLAAHQRVKYLRSRDAFITVWKTMTPTD